MRFTKVKGRVASLNMYTVQFDSLTAFLDQIRIKYLNAIHQVIAIQEHNYSAWRFNKRSKRRLKRSIIAFMTTPCLRDEPGAY